MFKYLITWCAICTTWLVFCLPPHMGNGSFSRGLSNITAVSQPSYAVNNNSAFLIQKDRRTALSGSFYHQYHLNELSSMDLNLSTMSPTNGFGFSINRFGSKYYNTSHINLAYSHNLGNVSLGLKNSVIQEKIDENGQLYSYALSFHSRFTIDENTFIGLVVDNLSSREFQQENHIYSIGASHKPSDPLCLYVQYQIIKEQNNYAIGFSYKINEALQVIASTNPNLKLYSTALEININTSLSGTFAYQYHSSLGNSYSITLSQSWQRK